MFELQYYYDDSKVRYRLPVDQDVERQHYKVAPFINKQIGEVRTIMTPKQILQIGMFEIPAHIELRALISDM